MLYNLLYSQNLFYILLYSIWWLNFFCPILEHFCPLLVQIAQMGLISPRWGLILPRVPPPTPVLYSAVTKPFRGYVRTQTPPAQPQNTPFPGLILKVGKMNCCLGKLDPIWAKCLKSGQNFSRSGQMFLFIIICYNRLDLFLHNILCNRKCYITCCVIYVITDYVLCTM